MAQVTVGVPVYNGAEYLEKCLAGIRDQTYRDIEVLIFDNCSEDATPEIAQRFCAQDPRFRYFRQPENKGPLPNFWGLVEAARTPFFMWRAVDDSSDLNYIEALLPLLLAHPDRDLAVPRIVSALPDGRKKKVRPVSALLNFRPAARPLQFFRQRAAWIYGLFRREAILAVMPGVMAEYPYVWGWDVAALMPFGLKRATIGTNATTFYQQRHFRPARKEDDRYGAQGEARIEMVLALEAFAHREIDRSLASPLDRWLYHHAVPYFGHKRGYPFSKRLWRWTRARLLGRSPAR
jgi:Glycosyl transferase family 2